MKGVTPSPSRLPVMVQPMDEAPVVATQAKGPEYPVTPDRRMAEKSKQDFRQSPLEPRMGFKKATKEAGLLPDTLLAKATRHTATVLVTPRKQVVSVTDKRKQDSRATPLDPRDTIKKARNFSPVRSPLSARDQAVPLSIGLELVTEPDKRQTAAPVTPARQIVTAADKRKQDARATPLDPRNTIKKTRNYSPLKSSPLAAFSQKNDLNIDSDLLAGSGKRRKAIADSAPVTPQKQAVAPADKRKQDSRATPLDPRNTVKKARNYSPFKSSPLAARNPQALSANPRASIEPEKNEKKASAKPQREGQRDDPHTISLSGKGGDVLALQPSDRVNQPASISSTPSDQTLPLSPVPKTGDVAISCEATSQSNHPNDTFPPS